MADIASAIRAQGPCGLVLLGTTVPDGANSLLGAHLATVYTWTLWRCVRARAGAHASVRARRA
jgi:electron transfer flavoprotein alpha/beta subunit